MLRESEKEPSLPFARIFSELLAESKIALGRKRTHVPIYKKRDKNQPGRPVSLTSLVCKILESIMKDKFVEYPSETNLIKDTQHGYG